MRRLGRQGVAGPVCIREFGEVGGVGVDEVRCEHVNNGPQQKLHEPAQHDQVQIPHPDLLEEVHTSFFPASETTERNGQGRDPKLLGVGEPIGVAVCANGDLAAESDLL